MAATSKEVRTHCVGRHQIDLPAEFEQMMSATSVFTPPGLTEDDAPVEVTVVSNKIPQSEFKTRVDQRHARILAAADERTDILKEVLVLSKEATVFRINRVKNSYTSELHLWKGGTYLTAETKSYNQHFAQAEARLAAFAANVELAGPGHGGFCLGPVAVKGQYAGESASYDFRSKARPDLLVSLEVNTFRPDESVPLLKRVGGADSLLNKFKANNKVMRQGELNVAGMRAQEWLSWIRLGEKADHKQYGFALETMRPKPALMQPHLHLELDSGQGTTNGEPNPNSLSDAEAVALWDAMVKSLRARP